MQLAPLAQLAQLLPLLLFKHPQVENGDLNWIVPGKLVAFSGPAVRPTDYVGFRAMVPEDYWDYWHKRGVQAVVRLNKKVGTACTSAM